MPKNTNIVLIRHAEKPEPDPGTGLSIEGQERAQAYGIYFQNYLIGSTVVKWNYIFASDDSSKSQRPRLTIQPLADALELGLNDTSKDDDYGCLASALLENAIYDQSNILICWHHGTILDLAAALGAQASKLPKKSTWPEQWPGHVFGAALQISYDQDGNIIPSQTLCRNQKLMFGDHGNTPPNFLKRKRSTQGT